MGFNSKKIIVASFLCITFLGISYVSINATGEPPEYLINLLKDQIKILEQKIAALKNTSNISDISNTPTSSAPTFTKTLFLGSRDVEVETLQNFLAQYPEIYPEGIATGFFGTLTERAVLSFQEKYGLEQVGIVGPLTRKKLNELIQTNDSPRTPHQETTSSITHSITSTIVGTTTIAISSVEKKIIILNNTSTLISTKSSPPIINSEPEEAPVVIEKTASGTTSTSTIAQTVTSSNKFLTNQIFISTSINKGSSFSAPFHLSNTSSEARAISIESTNNLLAIVWQETLNNKTDIFFSKSENNGQTFTEAKNLSNSVGFFVDSVSEPTLAINENGDIFVAWEKTTYKSENEISDQEVFLTESGDQGDTWKEPKDISKSRFVARNPLLKIVGNNLIIATWIEHPISYSLKWREDGKYFFGKDGGPHLVITHSINNGLDFTEPKQITDDIPINSYSIAVDSFQKIHIVFQTDVLSFSDNTIEQGILFTSSMAPESFSAPINISKNDGLSGSPVIMIDNFRNIYIVWSDIISTSKNFEILFTKSTDVGKTFLDPINISNTPDSHSLLKYAKESLAHDTHDDILYATWMEIDPLHKNEADIYLEKTGPNGSRWEVGQVITKKPFKYFESALNINPKGTLVLGIVGKEKPELRLPESHY